MEPEPSGIGALAPGLPSDSVIDATAPTVPVSKTFVFLYALAYTGVWLALLTPMLVTIAVLVRKLAPQNAASDVALVLGVGAIFAMVGNPVFGHLSDRTTSRYGMRRPWLIGGMLCGTAALALVATASNIFIALLGWCLAQLAFNAVLAAIVAILPDQVPATQRGTVAGVLGVCMPIGQVAGTYVVQALPDSLLLMFVVPAAIGLFTVLVLAMTLRDRRLPVSRVPARDFRELLRSFWLDPRRYPDFFWAWLSRFLLVTGTAFLTTYQSNYLIDKMGASVSDVRALIFQGMLVQAALIIASSLISGKASDASGQRKVFVLAAAAVYGSGLWIIAGATDYSGFLMGMAFTGVGQGVFFAVELALVTQILPNRELNAAKDLGMFNIANTLPQSIAPALGWMILSVGHGNYTSLFIVAGSIAMLSSLAIIPLRGVR
ncbi:MAG TPA: MFS transporter [Povalibacter sp.]